MKNYYISILAVLLFTIIIPSALSADSGEWIRKGYYNGGFRKAAVSFTIGDMAYVGTGSNDMPYEYRRDFYKYNPQIDGWTKIAELPSFAEARDQAIGFSVNGKGYVVGGEKYGLLGNNCLQDCWEYNPQNNIWYQRADFPRLMKCGVSFTIGNKAYVGLGVDDYLRPYSDFYEFDPATNKWKQLNDFPGTHRENAVAFSLNGKGYVGLGFMFDAKINRINFTDFWEYDPTTDVWSRLKDFPGVGRFSAMGYGLGKYCYVGLGKPNDFYRYDTETKEWEPLGYLPGEGRDVAYSFCVNKKIYYGGGEGSKTVYSDLWEFNKSDLSTGVEYVKTTSIYIYPNPVVEGFTIQESAGATSVILTDLSGKQVLKQKITENQTYVPLNRIAKGIYVVSLLDKNGTSIYQDKIIKE